MAFASIVSYIAHLHSRVRAAGIALVVLGVFAVALVALVLNSGMDLAGVAALVIALGFLAAAFVIVVLGVGWEGFRAGRDLFRKQPPRD